MECSLYVQLLSKFEAATAEFFAAASNLFAVAGNGDRLSFFEIREITERAHDRCRSTLAALNLHRARHHCTSGKPITGLR
jgi:hypothetical protein